MYMVDQTSHWKEDNEMRLTVVEPRILSRPQPGVHVKPVEYRSQIKFVILTVGQQESVLYITVVGIKDEVGLC